MLSTAALFTGILLNFVLRFSCLLWDWRVVHCMLDLVEILHGSLKLVSSARLPQTLFFHVQYQGLLRAQNSEMMLDQICTQALNVCRICRAPTKTILEFNERSGLRSELCHDYQSKFELLNRYMCEGSVLRSPLID